MPSATRNVRLYPWYAFTFNAYAWMPVFVLYFLEHMPLADVLRLEAVYYAGVVVLEVPSGYFSDRIGRRPTLLIANTCMLAACVVFVLASSFSTFAVAQVLLAAGLAFNSGTDTSLHYDSLATIDRRAEYGPREATAARNALFATGLAGLAGGAIAMIDLRGAYVLSGLAAAASLVLVAGMAEPVRHERMLVPDGPLRAAGACAGRLRDRVLGWTFAWAIVMTVLNHVPYEFYQPYIEHAFAGDARWTAATPLTSGVHLGAVMLVASVAAAGSIRLRDRLGYVPLLLASTALQVVIILAMGLVLHPLLLLLVLARSVPRGMTAAPMNAAIAPRVDTRHRATYFSIQSLAGRLAFAGYLVVIAAAAPHSVDPTSWAAIAWRLVVTAVAGAVALAALTAFAPRNRRRV